MMAKMMTLIVMPATVQPVWSVVVVLGVRGVLGVVVGSHGFGGQGGQTQEPERRSKDGPTSAQVVLPLLP